MSFAITEGDGAIICSSYNDNGGCWSNDNLSAITSIRLMSPLTDEVAPPPSAAAKLDPLRPAVTEITLNCICSLSVALELKVTLKLIASWVLSAAIMFVSPVKVIVDDPFTATGTPLGDVPMKSLADFILDGFVTEKVMAVNSVGRLSASFIPAPPSLKCNPITPVLPLTPVVVLVKVVPW